MLHGAIRLIGAQQAYFNHERRQVLQASACQLGIVEQQQASLDQIFQSAAPFVADDPSDESTRKVCVNHIVVGIHLVFRTDRMF